MNSPLNKPTHLLVECPELIPSVRVGVLDILEYLEKKGRCAVRFRRTVDITNNDIEWCDSFISVRGCEYLSWYWVQLAKSYARNIVYFLDDDLLNVPVTQESARYFRDTVIREYLLKTLSLADTLWVVNPRLGEKYSQLSGVPFVVEAIPATVPQITYQKRNKCIQFVFAGSTDHLETIKTYIIPAIKKLLIHYPDSFTFTFIGPDPGLKDYAQVQHLPFFDSYNDYTAFMNKNHFDIGVAPILPQEFFTYKYYNKFIEYTKFGIVGIYSHMQPYSDIIKHGKNGFLCNNTWEDWYAVFEKIITDPNIFYVCIHEARKNIENNFSYACLLKKIEKDIQKLFIYKAPTVYIFEKIYFTYFVYYIEKIKIYWGSYGIRSIPYIIKKGFKVIFKKR